MKIEEQYEKLFRYCYMKTRNRHVAEDLTQETFLRFQSSKNYKDIGKCMSYLYAIARNLCVDYFREVKTVELDPNIAYIEETRDAYLEEALDKISDEDREILFLRYTNDMSINELAKYYYVSRFVISRRIKKALNNLKEEYDNGR